jgi:predicted  nucleic acid-binding Zn-ribbon protein
VKASRSRTVRAVAAVVAALALAAGAPGPATASDIDQLRARAQEIADEVTATEVRLADLRAQRAGIEERLAHADARIAALELERQEAARAYEHALDAYVADAVELYKSPSAGMNLELILSARDVNDLLLLTHVTNATAEQARESLTEVMTERDRAAALQEQVDGHKQGLLADARRLDAVAEDVSSTLAERRSTLKDFTEQIAELEAEARAAVAAAPTRDLGQVLGPGGPSLDIPGGFVSTGVAFEGEASWYGPGFEGNTTANGEIFDSRKFTAASKELPFNTWLFIEYNGKGVVVRINDRGPYAGNRILDLSAAAAQAIGMSGVGWVHATIIVKR